jgi:hypothetical protein
VDGGVDELLGGLGVKVFDQFGGVFDVGKQHCHLLAFAFQGATGRQNLLRQVRRGIRDWCTPLLPRCQRCWWACYPCVPSPDQDPSLLIHRHLPGINEFILESLKVVVVQAEPDFERSIGYPPLALE